MAMAIKAVVPGMMEDMEAAAMGVVSRVGTGTRAAATTSDLVTGTAMEVVP